MRWTTTLMYQPKKHQSSNKRQVSIVKHPASSIQHPASGIQHQASSIKTFNYQSCSDAQKISLLLGCLTMKIWNYGNLHSCLSPSSLIYLTSNLVGNYCNNGRGELRNQTYKHYQSNLLKVVFHSKRSCPIQLNNKTHITERMNNSQRISILLPHL